MINLMLSSLKKPSFSIFYSKRLGMKIRKNKLVYTGLRHNHFQMLTFLILCQLNVKFEFIAAALTRPSVSRPGGPFDLMSRRLIVASSRAIARRVANEITEFPVGRDDTDG